MVLYLKHLLITCSVITAVTNKAPHTLRCNMTSYGHDFQGKDHEPLLAKAIGLREAYLDRPVFCVYTFLGVPGQRILIHLHKFKVGEYDAATGECVRGYLRLWDGLNQPGRHRYLPNMLCGNFNSKKIDVRKLTTDHSARLEFHVDKLLQYTKFKATYQYISVDNVSTNHTSVVQHDMLLVSKAVCDYQVLLDTCNGPCTIISPGYPGIYPPNVECQYRIRGPKNNIIKLQFRSFNILYSPECKDHWLRIYTGSPLGADRKLVGTFCGNSAPDFTYTGSVLHLTFSSGLDRPPYSYTGFYILAQSLPRGNLLGGELLEGTMCSYRFNTTDILVESPDHYMPPRSFCSYDFRIPPKKDLELVVTVRGLLPSCLDSVDIYQNQDLVDNICFKDLTGKDDQFFYTLRGDRGVVHYYRVKGQLRATEKYGITISVRAKQVKNKRDEDAKPAFQVTTTDRGHHVTPSCVITHVTMVIFVLLVIESQKSS